MKCIPWLESSLKKGEGEEGEGTVANLDLVDCKEYCFFHIGVVVAAVGEFVFLLLKCGSV